MGGPPPGQHWGGQPRAQWVHTSAHTPLPQGAIFVGNDVDGSPMYVGRAHHNADQLPAKVIPSKNVAYGKLNYNLPENIY